MDYKKCTRCRQLLNLSYPDELCPACKEIELFNEVKDFIRKNNVTEYQVADFFQIPLKKVKGWIREGRIEYKDNNFNKKISATTNTCFECGATILTGSFCKKCAIKNQARGIYVSPDDTPAKIKFHTRENITKNK